MAGDRDKTSIEIRRPCGCVIRRYAFGWDFVSRCFEHGFLRRGYCSSWSRKEAAGGR